MKGWVPTDAEGAGPGEGGRTAEAFSLLLCAMVSIKSQTLSTQLLLLFSLIATHTSLL